MIWLRPVSNRFLGITILLLSCRLTSSAKTAEYKTKTGHSPTPFPSPEDDRRLQEGQLNYNVAVQSSRIPKYGECWKKALASLHLGCKELTEDVQQQLALRFTNCFLEKAGQETYPFEEDDDLQQKLSGMSSNGFTAYTNFYTHVQSMCYFLEAQAWHEQTENTMSRWAQLSYLLLQMWTNMCLPILPVFQQLGYLRIHLGLLRLWKAPMNCKTLFWKLKKNL